MSIENIELTSQYTKISGFFKELFSVNLIFLN